MLNKNEGELIGTALSVARQGAFDSVIELTTKLAVPAFQAFQTYFLSLNFTLFFAFY